MVKVWNLAKRNMKIFFRDKTAVFFSLLSPLIVLALYILFLKDVNYDGAKATLDAIEGFTYDTKHLEFLFDGWMITGMLGVATLTVPLSGVGVLISDRTRHIDYDSMASPIKQSVVTLGYFVSMFLSSMIIITVVLMVGYVYIVISSGVMLGMLQIIETLGVVALASLFSSLLFILFTKFIKTESAFTGFNIIIGTVAGFLVGGYISLAMFPGSVQTIAGCIPTTHATALLRNVFLFKTVKTVAGTDASLFKDLQEQFGTNLELFGHVLEVWQMLTILVCAVLIILVISMFFVRKRRIKNS